jgi:nickel-dependent lactate racemase
MRIAIDYGQKHLELDLPASSVLKPQSAPPAPPVADPAAAVRLALDAPHGWPPLRRALTPDDHVAVIIDEHLPQLAKLLTPVLEHIGQAGVAPDAVTLVCPPTNGGQKWVEELPDAFQEVHVEVHNPDDRRKLAYLAMTRHGRRVYLNRTAVDADQVVVFSGRGYDPVTGYSGAEAAIYPALGDTATRSEVYGRPSLAVPGEATWPARQEAAEVAWLLGAPFLVQLIEGAGEEIAHVIGGSLDSSEEGRKLLDERWRSTVPEPADVVLAAVSGDPARHDFGTLAQALASAARVVQPGGRIVLLTQVKPQLNSSGDLLREAETPRDALEQLKRQKSPEAAPAFLWASAAEKAKVYLLSGLPGETAEALFTTPLEKASQVERLLSANHQTCLVMPDAHKTMAITAE